SLLKRIATEMEQGKPASALGLKDDEEKAVRSFQFLTLKPEIVLVTTDETGVGQPVPSELGPLAPSTIVAAANLELELQTFPEDERQAFMSELGMRKSVAIDTLRAIFAAMDQIVFFTVGEDECRAWALTRGENSVTGAAQIHTDLAKRFVRAEVVSFGD